MNNFKVQPISKKQPKVSFRIRFTGSHFQGRIPVLPDQMIGINTGISIITCTLIIKTVNSVLNSIFT